MQQFIVRCQSGCVNSVDPSQLEDAFSVDSCPTCGGSIADVLPAEVEVRCFECGWFSTVHWRNAMEWLSTPCSTCTQNNDTPSGNIHVVNSLADRTSPYDDFLCKNDAALDQREDRDDYWEYLIHFCRPDAFANILTERCIRASPTGRFGLSAVCLTDTPVKYAAEFRQTYGPFGLAFRKSEVLRYGGNPVLYLTDALIARQQAAGGFATELKPFVNVVRISGIKGAPATGARRVDFMHDREWRVAADIDLDVLPPVGLVLLPGDKSTRFPAAHRELILEAATHFGEVSY
jgi:hypothetical protein